MKIVSACLAGINCRWDGKSNPRPEIIELVKQGKAIPVCPEQLGGFSTPRCLCEQRGKNVFTKDGEDVTEQFTRWAEETLKIAKLANCKEAILKGRSPSCGSEKVYDGTFSGKLISGDGVTAKLLKENGIKITIVEVPSIIWKKKSKNKS